MIKVKISDLLNGTEALQKLAGTDLKAKVAWQVGKLIKAAEAEMQSFNTTRVELIKKYGEKNESGELITDDEGNCKINGEKVTDFSNELNDLINQEVELNASKLNMDEIGDVNFTPTEMVGLEPFFYIEDETVPE